MIRYRRMKALISITVATCFGVLLAASAARSSLRALLGRM
jgi:hypothetical protein